MAYFTQEMKKEMTPRVKAVLKKYNMKGAIAVRHNSTCCINLSQGPLDLIGLINEAQKIIHERLGIENQHHHQRHASIHHGLCDRQKQIAKHGENDFIEELVEAIKSVGWYDKSDTMTDYFNTAFYFEINVGTYKKDYVLTGPKRY